MAAPDPFTPALELAAALRSREVSAVELLDACLAAVDARDPELNAVTWRNDEQARADAADADRRLADGEDAPFLGVPMPIKDLTPVAGWPVTYGSHGAPEGPSEQSELVVDAFTDAGFVLCARTNTPAFGVITAAENLRHGISRNPWDAEQDARRLERRRRWLPWPAACSRSPTPTTAAARSASPPPTAGSSGSSPAAGAFRAWPRAGSAPSSRASSRTPSPTPPPCSTRSPASTRSPGTTPPRPPGRSARRPKRRPGSCASG